MGGVSRGPYFRVRQRARPEWWREYSDGELPFEEPVLERDSMHLVLQEDRQDGPDMLTLRYPFMALGAFEIYAGAGLGQVVYLAENGVGPILLFGRPERHRSVHPAAELVVSCVSAKPRSSASICAGSTSTMMQACCVPTTA